ncbi:MAG: HAD-IC family P-type ATPase, partial [Clostridia bacterium]|nr:HAD-IC family P-type ATPase [Clostridia bacterium]
VFTKPLAFIMLQNNVKADAKKTFGYFTEQGVAIKVISGDNPVTASAAAQQAGIPNSDKYVNLASVPEDKFEEAVLTYTVFGRVTPDQKRSILKVLKKNGHTVAMTGDGVNDVLALKEADCSIAMASGSEVASQISQLVLLDSNFSSMPHIVSEGRRVINNIQRSASLFIVKNIFSFFMAMLAIIIAFEYPFAPRQITLVSALTIGSPDSCWPLSATTKE